MQGDGLELTGGAQRMDLYMNEQPCKIYASYADPGFYISALDFQRIHDFTS